MSFHIPDLLAKLDQGVDTFILKHKNLKEQQDGNEGGYPEYLILEKTPTASGAGGC
jgi:hypothetical protein